MCTADGGDSQARAQGFALNGTGSLTNFQQVVLAYLKKCGIKHIVIHGGKRQNESAGTGMGDDQTSSRRDWGDKYPPSIGLNHSHPSPEAISRFNANMIACEGGILKK